MSFRRRITLVSAAAVAIAVILASSLTYLLTSHQLHSQVDTQLRHRVLETDSLQRFLGGRARPHLFGRLPPTPDQVRGYQQLVSAGGAIIARSAPVSLPVDAGTRALAEHGGKPFFKDVYVNGVHQRILSAPFGSGRAVQVAEPLTEVDSLLSRLRLILAVIVVGGIALAALLGRLVAGAAVGPLRRLTRATEHVALTRDLSGRIEPVGEDEIGRLAGSFNAMLDALERSVNALDASVDAQRQLVADASHELRTPVTSVRTNIEILQQLGEELEPEDQRRLLADVVEQVEELTQLIGDLIDLARGEEPRVDMEDVRLDLLVADVVERARRHAPSTPLLTELEPTIVTCVPSRLERAVSNLIDNAVKYGPPGETVEISLHGGELAVRDHGPGISPEDLPHVFDRFYRGAEARGLPGSGLGLAIVRQVAGQQGGTIVAEPAPGGGTLMRLALPSAEPLQDADLLDGGRSSFAGAVAGGAPHEGPPDGNHSALGTAAALEVASSGSRPGARSRKRAGDNP